MNNGKTVSFAFRKPQTLPRSGWVIVALVLAHAAATCRFLPPAEIDAAPFLAAKDYAVHSHRVHAYREALRQSDPPWWTCDPALCAGKTRHPAQDIGTVPQSIVALAFPNVSAGKVVAWFSWLAIFLLPVPFAAAGYVLRFEIEEVAWGLVLALAMLWLAPPFGTFLRQGLSAFQLSSFMAILVLAAYLRFLRAPTVGRCAAATLAGSLLFLVHPFGPLVILPSLIFSVVASRLTWRWFIAAALSPLVIAGVNSFWLVPLLYGLQAPPPPWATEVQLAMPYWVWGPDFRLSDYLAPHLLLAYLLTASASVLAWIHLARQHGWITAIALGLALLVSLMLTLFGSSWSVTRMLQPIRFVAIACLILALVGGYLIVLIHRTIKSPSPFRWGSQCAAVVVLILAVSSFGPRLRQHPDAPLLIRFAQEKTRAGERLLVEAEASGTSITMALPMVIGREVISSAFPDHSDPVQFNPERLFHRDFPGITQHEARASIERFGIDWVFVHSEHWQTFFQRLTRQTGEEVGGYRAFEISRHASRFLLGSGDVVAEINRIAAFPNGDADAIVLRYRYHPGWTCDGPSKIESFAIPEDPSGFLLIRSPGDKVVLRFDPRLALRRDWPVPTGPSGEHR